MGSYSYGLLAGLGVLGFFLRKYGILAFVIFFSDDIILVLFFQAFREEIAPINLKVKTVNDLSSQLSPLDLHPSLKMSRQLDDLNMRWKLLQVSADSSS